MSGMNLWKVRIHKAVGAEDWSNVYTVNAANLSAAQGVAAEILLAERSVHSNEVQFGVVEVEPAVLGAGGGTVFTAGGTGTAEHTVDAGLLFITARVLFRPAAGKPSQKYLRGVIYSGVYDVDTGTIAAGAVAFISTNYLTPMLAIPEFVDVDGQSFTGGAVVPHVQERQLKRKRRSRPGFIRGWVPV